MRTARSGKSGRERNSSWKASWQGEALGARYEGKGLIARRGAGRGWKADAKCEEWCWAGVAVVPFPCV